MTRGAPLAVARCYNDPRIRGLFYQIVLLVVVLWLGYEFFVNARDNLRAAKIATGLRLPRATPPASTSTRR